MKTKHFFLAAAAVLAAIGLWLARPAWRTPVSDKPSMGVASETPPGPPKAGQTSVDVGSETHPGATNPGQMLRPPEPNRRFTDFTPEQRVEFARKGHGPGG